MRRRPCCCGRPGTTRRLPSRRRGIRQPVGLRRRCCSSPRAPTRPSPRSPRTSPRRRGGCAREASAARAGALGSRPMVRRLLRHAATGCANAARAGYGLGSFLYAVGRGRASRVTEAWSGALDLATATRVAVFAHFDAEGIVREFVHHYLREINRAGFALVVATNGPRLRAADLERLRPLSALIVRRDNVGRDFGAYRDGIAAIP